jgi:shikimate kinase
LSDPSEHGRHVVLVGLMGTGKTTVGRLLAERLGRDLCDSDAMVEARTGRTVRQIWEADGEPAYRVEETSALHDALDSVDPRVVAAAGGVVLRAENRRALKAADATVVWLRAAPEVLVERAVTGEHRPLLDQDPLARLREMASARDSLYREVADVEVDVTDRAPEAVAGAILRAIGVTP